MKQPSPQQIEAAMRREWDYLNVSMEIGTKYTAVQIIPVIWESLKMAVDVVMKGQIQNCLMEVLKIAAIADGFRIKSTAKMRRMGDVPPDNKPVSLGDRLEEIRYQANQLSLGDHMMNIALLALVRCCKYTIYEHGLYERFGGMALCPNCGYQVKRMAHNDGERWEMFWGCDNDCNEQGHQLGNPKDFSFLDMCGPFTTRQLVLLNYQIVI